MNTILVTGGAGFIGSHLIDQLIESNTDYTIYNVDKMGIGSCLSHLRDKSEVTNIFRDISEDGWYDDIPKVDFIIHCAAESHVDRSITNPLSFIDSNVRGTANVLELCKRDNARMVHVSTDEVYGHLVNTDDPPFTELTALNPRSPYSASKASSDLLALSYCTTYGLDVSVTRCCNNYGPRQHSEKLIPTVIRSLMSEQKIPVYGNGQNVREWIHVEDHANQLLNVLFKGVSNEVYNITGSTTLSNIELISTIVSEFTGVSPDALDLDKYITFVEDRKGHDFRYELDTIHKHDAVVTSTRREFELKSTIEWFKQARVAELSSKQRH